MFYIKEENMKKIFLLMIKISINQNNFEYFYKKGLYERELGNLLMLLNHFK